LTHKEFHEKSAAGLLVADGNVVQEIKLKGALTKNLPMLKKFL